MPFLVRSRSRAARASLALAAFGALAGCHHDSTGPRIPPATGKALVLITYGEPGVTIVPDSGVATGHVNFDEQFDGVTFTVAGDSVASASSKFGGDKLFVTNVATGGVSSVPLPAGSNPGGAVFLPSTLPNAGTFRVAVALRDSAAIALVRPPGAIAPEVRLLHGAGVCPGDVFVLANTIWSADANQRCTGDYAVLGPARLIGMIPDSARRDTLSLPDSAIGGARAIAVPGGSAAIVVTTGDYATRPGYVTRVSVPARMTAQVTGRLALPSGYYATAARFGRDGLLYVTASLGWPADYAPRVFAVSPQTMTFTGRRAAGQQYLDLRDDQGALVRCDAASASAEGDIYCASNGAVTSRLLVFSPPGAILRDVPTGGLAADVEVR